MKLIHDGRLAAGHRQLHARPLAFRGPPAGFVLPGVITLHIVARGSNRRHANRFHAHTPCR
ncbi:hypothetical protein [Burkholderia ambifaria]|uniref:hypothetical protein n=1 Tax=Burkholderia ambifaria TaxID=152480 RepID=UPI0015895A3D|nr:hypothetical protein [Burkholderia ambifaria]